MSQAQNNQINLFRIVHWKNVEHILQYGMCHKKHTNANPDYVNIGHVGLISDRDQFDVPLENAGTLGEYVPFYFGGHSPMLYMIMNGYSGVEKQPQSDIVYIICTVEKISSAGCEFVFTDRHAKVRIAKYYRSESDFDKIDWNAVKVRTGLTVR